MCAQTLCHALHLATARNDPSQLVKEAQALHVRSEMAALATEAKSLMDVDTWLAPEPPHPPGGTRLPHLFGALAHERMLDLVRRANAYVTETARVWLKGHPDGVICYCVYSSTLINSGCACINVETQDSRTNIKVHIFL